MNKLNLGNRDTMHLHLSDINKRPRGYKNLILNLYTLQSDDETRRKEWQAAALQPTATLCLGHNGIRTSQKKEFARSNDIKQKHSAQHTSCRWFGTTRIGSCWAFRMLCNDGQNEVSQNALIDSAPSGLRPVELWLSSAMMNEARLLKMNFISSTWFLVEG